MTSTVLDAALCLLLVSASVAVVTDARPSTWSEGDDADAAVETLATSTAVVTYELAVDGATANRTTHRTLAGHLAEATLASVAVEDRRISPVRAAYVSAVVERVDDAVGANAQVVAVWRPYPGASLAGRVVVGPSPPPTATVHAETTRVASGLPAVRPTVTRASDADATALARTLADGLVDGLFPPDSMRYALDDPSVAPFARARYRDAGVALDVSTPTPLTSDDVARTNERLAAALAGRLVAAVPAHPAERRDWVREVRADAVTITVRTWS